MIIGQTTRWPSIVLLLTLWPGIPGLAGPQEQPAQDATPAPRFETEVVVTPERGETPRTSVPVATSVLDAPALSALPAAHLSEVLPFLAGFVTARSEFHAGRPIASARGFFGGGEAEYLVLLVDGVPVADVESGLIDWSVVPTASMMRVEASRGPGSSLYGDSAVGGVVQVLTERAGTGGRLTLEGGSFATFIGDGSYGRRRDGVSVQISGAARTTDGAFEHSAGAQYNGTGSLDGRFGGFSWRATGAANHQRRDEPGAEVRDAPEANAAAPSPYRFDETARTGQSAAFTLRHGSARWSPQLRVYAGARGEDSLRTTLLAPEFPIRQARDLSTTAIGGTFDSEHRFTAPVVVRFGADLSRESLDSAYSTVQPTGAIGVPTFAANGRRVRSGAFAAASVIPTPRVRVSGALRWDGVADSGFAQPPSGASPSAWSPRAGVVVYANDARTISVFAQVARAFKMPTLDQLFDVRPFPDFGGGTITISNPTLQPQRATNLEAGITGGTRVSWSAVLYRMDVTNEIDFDVRTFSYGNIGRSDHNGLELEIESREWNRLRPFASYTLSRAVDDETGAQLKNVSRHALGIGASADVWWRIGLYARYSRRWGAYLDDDNTLPLDGPSRLDIRIRRPIGRHQLFVDLYNITNDRFEEYGYTLSDFTGRVVAYVYPGAGAAARAGFTLSF